MRAEQEDLPRYIIVKAAHMAGHKKTSSARVSLNDGPAFGRNIRPWGKGSDAWFFNLTQDQCRRSDARTGDRVKVRIEIL